MFDNMLSLNEAMVPLHSIAGQSSGCAEKPIPRGAFNKAVYALSVPDNII